MSTDANLLPDPAALPDDPTLLRQLVLQLLEILRDERRRTAALEHRLDLLLRRIYGRSSEKVDPRQGTLFDPAAAPEEPAPETPAEAPPAADDLVASTGKKPKRKGHGRRRLPETIEKREVLHDLTDAEKAAMGGEENLVLIGRQVTVQLEWEPSCLYVVEHVQLSYARRDQLPESGSSPSEKNVITASKPPQPIPSGLPGPGLLAQVLASKYADHIPLHRFERISARHGVELSRRTTCDWAMACADLFRPLYHLMIDEVLASWVVHTDDTTVKIRDATKKLQLTGYLWVYYGDGRHPLIVFDYTSTHSRDGPARFLGEYRGYLQADAAGVYDELYNKPGQLILEAGCWMHARRYFFEARRLDPLRAGIALARIRELYAVERRLTRLHEGEWRELPLVEVEDLIAAARQEHSVPILNELHTWLEQEAPKLLPKHPMREAIDYALNHWTALFRYATDGALDIDNGASERTLRPLTLGRKNWLFCGSERGAKAAAIHFSLIASCHRHGLDAFFYLRELLTELPKLGPNPTADQLRPFLADRWRPPATP
jgi:transposase